MDSMRPWWVKTWLQFDKSFILLHYTIVVPEIHAGMLWNIGIGMFDWTPFWYLVGDIIQLTNDDSTIIVGSTLPVVRFLSTILIIQVLFCFQIKHGLSYLFSHPTFPMMVPKQHHFQPRKSIAHLHISWVSRDSWMYPDPNIPLWEIPI